MPSEFQKGTLIDHYRVERLLGAGGSSAVYQVFDEDLQRALAVKVLHRWSTGSTDNVLRFEREAKILSQLLHPNIVRVYRFGFLQEDRPYLVMELLEGESLKTVLEKRKQLPCHEAIAIAEQVCSAMEFAHSLNVLHRDLKPENIIIIEEPQGKTAKLLDFGLCKQIGNEKKAGNTLTETGFLVGTAQYMSPEQCMGSQLDLRSDIYSFGCVLYEMITGRSPFLADMPAAVFLMHMSTPMPRILDLAPDSGLPQELEDLLLKCCKKKKEDRYQSFTELRMALVEISQLNCRATFDTTSAAKGQRQFRRVLRKIPVLPKQMQLGLALACLLAIAVTAYFITGTDAGIVFFAVQIQSRLNAGDAIDTLTQELSSMIGSGRINTARELIEATTKSQIYHSWPNEYREKLLLEYISICKKAKLDEEAFSLSLVLLQNLLEHQIRSVELKTEKPNLTLLQRLSQELANENHSKKQWAQIYQIIELRKNVFKKVPDDMAWTGYLRCVSNLKRQAPETDDDPSILAKQYQYCLIMALGFGDLKLINRVTDESSQFNLAHNLFSFESIAHTESGHYYAQKGQVDLAKKELAIAERFAGDRVFSGTETARLQDLRSFCLTGKFIEKASETPRRETNVKWLLQYTH